MSFADLITSNTGKDGGFQLACSIEKISIYDVYCALEGEECELKMSGIGKRIFVYGREFSQGEEKVVSIFEQANRAFLDELRKLFLSELVSEKHYLKGTIDFGAMTNESDNN